MRMPRLPHDGHNAHQGPANGEAILDVEMFLARLVKLLVDGCVMHAVVRASGPQLTVRPSAVPPMSWTPYASSPDGTGR